MRFCLKKILENVIQSVVTERRQIGGFQGRGWQCVGGKNTGTLGSSSGDDMVILLTRVMVFRMYVCARLFIVSKGGFLCFN